MNIIYKLTNSENNKSYIGQKVECNLELLEGIPTIINSKTHLPYYGSSSNIEMKEALTSVKFIASIVEIVKDRKTMCEREEFHIRRLDAVNNENFYNMSYPLHYSTRDFQTSVKNEFGELYKDYASSASSVSKRINTAQKAGYKDLTSFYLKINCYIEEGLNPAEITRKLNLTRRLVDNILKTNNLAKFKLELSNYNLRDKNKIVNFRMKGASVKKIAEMMQLEVATILHYIGVSKPKDISFIVSARKGLTEDELGYKIMNLFLQNYKFSEISKELDIAEKQIVRSFHRFIRKHIEINDFNGIQN